MPKPLGSQAQEMVLSLVHYFEQERDNHGPLLPLTAVRDRVAAALNLSISSVNSIAAKCNKGGAVCSPKRKRTSTKPITDIDGFTQDAIRNVIYDMYKNKKHITLETLREILLERDIFNGCKTSLWKVLKKIGFKYKKDDPRRGLMELPNIAFKRVTFLSKYIKLKNEGLRQFVFLGETWIFQDGTVGRSWQDSNSRSVKKTKVGGSRYIVLHAGCSTGFVTGAELVFSSKTKDTDYHGEMNQENFLQWFEYQLLANLEEPSTIVMDNASYHSTLMNKVPTTSWKKQNIQEWLTNNNVLFDDFMLKTQLLALVTCNKPEPVYIADTLAEKYGHQVLRLPPYHCIFNPIEHIWGITKNYYRDHVGEGGRSSQKSLDVWREALGTVTPEIWAKTICHTEKEIQRWWEREVAFDQDDAEPVIINLECNDNTDSEYEYDLCD